MPLSEIPFGTKFLLYRRAGWGGLIVVRFLRKTEKTAEVMPDYWFNLVQEAKGGQGCTTFYEFRTFVLEHALQVHGAHGHTIRVHLKELTPFDEAFWAKYETLRKQFETVFNERKAMERSLKHLEG